MKDLDDLNKSAEIDPTSYQTVQPEHTMQSSETEQIPQGSPITALQMISPTASGHTGLLSPLFANIASSMAEDFDMDILDGRKNANLSWVPNLLATIINSELSQDCKQYWLNFSLRYISSIIIANDVINYNVAEDFGDLITDASLVSKEAIYSALLSQLKDYLAIKNSRYVFYVPYWTRFTPPHEPDEDRVMACIYETLARYLSQFVDSPLVG